jgi:uncharacterized protein YggE
MTRWALSIMAFAALCLAAGPIDASAQTARDGKIRILGRASVEATPDYVVVRVGITNKAATPSAALDQNSTIARKMIDFAKRFGIDEKNLQTDLVNLQPATKSVRDPSGNFRQEPDGYTASNLVRVKLSELPRLGTFMRQILDEGATNIAGVEFGLSNVEQVADQARVQAVENAIHQAQRLAEAAKVKLGPIHEIVHPPRTQVQHPDGVADMAVRQARRPSVPIEVGTIRITAEVDITWIIE